MSHLPDYETLRALARSNPEKLETLRRDLVRRVIDNAAPEQRDRLRGLQAHIDSVSAKAESPMDACIEVTKMMYKSLCALEQSLKNVVSANFAHEIIEDLVIKEKPRLAEVIPFPRSRGNER